MAALPRPPDAGAGASANAFSTPAVLSHVSAPSDAVLVQSARAGDASAFEALVRRHLRAAFAVALATLGNRADVEDVCQDAFLTALQRLEDCRQPEHFGAWLLQIVRNRARNFRSYRKVREAAPLELVKGAASDDPARDAERAELRERLMAALATLPEVQREIVLLHDLEGWCHQDIAAALRMSVAMSRLHLFNARRALRDRLGAHAYQEYRHAQ